MRVETTWERGGYVLRSSRAEDVDAYWEALDALDPEGMRLTGSVPHAREEVVSFFLRCVDDSNRCDLLIISPGGRVVGESVINEIDWVARSANFRICLFDVACRNHGLGSWATCAVRDLAFGRLGLHRLSLDVFSINPRARRVYEKAGFVEEGVARDAVWLGSEEGYCDDVFMAILEDEWRTCGRVVVDG